VLLCDTINIAPPGARLSSGTSTMAHPELYGPRTAISLGSATCRTALRAHVALSHTPVDAAESS
jgi:hypothetical protein